MAIVSDFVNNSIQQTLDPRIHYWDCNLSKIWRRAIQSSSDLVGSWGQGWVLRKIFMRGIGGVVAAGQMQSQGTLLASDNTVAPNFGILGKTAGQWAPGPDTSTTPQFFQYQVPLYKLMGNMTMELELRRQELIDATKSRITQATIDGAAKQLSLFKCNSFWAETAVLPTKSSTYSATFEGGVIGSFVTAADITLTGAGAADSITSGLTLTSGSIGRFYEGQQVDVICANGTNSRFVRVNAQEEPFFIARVDPLANKIWLLNRNRGGTTWTIYGDSTTGLTNNPVLITPFRAFANQTWLVGGSPSTAANAYIDLSTPAANTTYLPQLAFSIERFLKNSGGLLGTGTSHATSSSPSNSIDLAKFPDYKSYVVDAGGNALDESYLFGLTARLEQAGYTLEDLPDEFWGSPGVMTAFTEALNGLFVYQRNGERVDVQAGYDHPDGLTFRGFGGDYTIQTDRFVGNQKVYGVKGGKNFMEIGPPQMQGALSGPGGFTGRVEFLGRAFGYNDIWYSVAGDGTSGGAPTGVQTTLLNAPFFYPYQMWMDSMRGAKITNVGVSFGPTG